IGSGLKKAWFGRRPRVSRVSSRSDSRRSRAVAEIAVLPGQLKGLCNPPGRSLRRRVLGLALKHRFHIDEISKYTINYYQIMHEGALSTGPRTGKARRR